MSAPHCIHLLTADAGLDVGCPACVHAAERHNTEAARASGAVIHEDGSWSVHVS